jgi:hypothetical protein
MGKKTLQTSLILGFMILMGFPFAPRVSASVLSINELVENARDYDMQIVTIEAEAIGEVLRRNDGAWINVNDGTNAIGVWVSLSESEEITNFGDYDHVGDTVLITGIFHRSCPDHGGEMDIHAEELLVSATGSVISHPLSMPKLIWAGSLLTISTTLLVIHLRSRRKKRHPSKPATDEE